jgi:hypothetical protein
MEEWVIRALIAAGLAVAAAVIANWGKVKAAAPDTLASKILSDLPDLKAAEQHLTALGRDAGEIVSLFETQLKKRIDAAKGGGE